MSSAATRVIVVLGYSDGGAGTIHPVCAARVARAAELATPDDVVVLSGWARVPGTRSEAELMAAAWSGSAREVVVDPDAQTTVGNARNALDDIRRVGAGEVVVVTSRWHAARARAAFRLLAAAEARPRRQPPIPQSRSRCGRSARESCRCGCSSRSSSGTHSERG